MSEGLEVEVKLSVDEPERIRALVESPLPELLAGFTADGPIRHVDVLDHYLDTTDGGLERAGARIRIRHDGEGWVATFKRQGVVGAAGVTVRDELEGPANGDLDPAGWPDSAARRAVLEIVGGASLVETARLRQRRLVRNVARAGTVVELSLDELQAIDGEAVVASRWELEAELKAGAREALEELAGALSRLPGLRPATESKRAFAMRMARESQVGG